MATPWPTATIVRGDSRTDAAVPPGTTVAGLLAMSEVDTSDDELIVILSDGSLADPAAIIGDDVPSGVLLAVTNATASRDAVERALREEPNEWLIHGPGEIAAALLSAALGVVGILPLMVHLPTFPDLHRWAASAFAFVMALPLVRSPHARTPGFALVVPLLLALPITSVIPVAVPLSDQLTLVVGMILTSVIAFLLNLTQRDAARLASAGSWALFTAVITLAVLLERSAHETATLVMAAAVVVIRLAPSQTLPVPETQLLDLPLLTTSAPTVRATPSPPPARITGRRVRRTVLWARGGTSTLTAAGSLAAAIAVFFVNPPLSPSGFQGWGTVVVLICTAAALALVPRADASAVGRWLPRLAAITIVGTVAWKFVEADPTNILTVLAVIIVSAGLFPLLTVALTREPRPALLGHLGDIAQGWSLALVLPAAFAASGLFDLFRELLQ